MQICVYYVNDVPAKNKKIKKNLIEFNDNSTTAITEWPFF